MKTKIKKVPGGGIVVDGGCTLNGNPVSSGTYTLFNPDGTTEPPQE